MRRILAAGFGLGLITTLAGCASTPLITDPPVDAVGMPNVQAALNAAILHTDQAVAQLDGTPVTTLASAPLPEVQPGELEQPMQWRYTGQLIPAVQAIGKFVNYRVVVEPGPHDQPIRVTVDADHMAAGGVIQALNTQAGSRAVVEADPRQQVIFVIEAGATILRPAIPPGPMNANPAATTVAPDVVSVRSSGSTAIQSSPLPPPRAAAPQSLLSP
jgi:hypothetical protein